MATLDKEDIEALAACITGTQEHKEHREHHEFIAEWIERERRKKERWEKIQTQVGGWAIIAVLGGIGHAFWNGFQYVRDHLK